MKRISILALGILLIMLSACSAARGGGQATAQITPAAMTAPFADSLGAALPEGDQTYEEYVTVQDDFKAIEMSVPVAWSQVDGSAWSLDDNVIGASLSASADLEPFQKSYTEPGVYFGVSDEMVKLAGYTNMLDLYKKTFSTDCTFSGRSPYRDATYAGAYDVYTNCSGAGNTMLLLSAQPSQNLGAHVLVLLVNLKSRADAAALDEILATLKVVGELP